MSFLTQVPFLLQVSWVPGVLGTTFLRAVGAVEALVLCCWYSADTLIGAAFGMSVMGLAGVFAPLCPGATLPQWHGCRAGYPERLELGAWWIQPLFAL